MKAISLCGNACASHYDVIRGGGANQRSIMDIIQQGLSPVHRPNRESVMRDEMLPPVVCALFKTSVLYSDR